MDRRAGLFALLFVSSLLKGQLHYPRAFQVMSMEPARKKLLQHRHRYKRAGNIGHRGPLGVAAGAGRRNPQGVGIVVVSIRRSNDLPIARQYKSPACSALLES